jgi:hypothetical protein
VITVRDLATELGVRHLDVTRALATLNASRSLTTPLTDDEVKRVTGMLSDPDWSQQSRAAPNPGPPSQGDAASGVREPRRPRPWQPSAVVALPEPD